MLTETKVKGDTLFSLRNTANKNYIIKRKTTLELTVWTDVKWSFLFILQRKTINLEFEQGLTIKNRKT